MNVVGLDIGGANIKAADSDGRSICRGFEIWRQPDRLTEFLHEVLAGLSDESRRSDCLAVTMTAELADCFRTKAEGVDGVLKAIEEVAAETPVFVWQTGAEFVTPAVARQIPLLVAAANWHALATFVGRLVPQSTALLIDIGTTTTDIIPLRNGTPIPQGLTDSERLQAGELVYTGVRRTPVCAVAHSVPFRRDLCPVAAELFATTLDVYVTLGDLAENAEDRDTANGEPATLAAAHDRLARMVCCDRTEFSAEDARTAAGHIADAQKRQLADALGRVLVRLKDDCHAVLISGTGSFLAQRLIAECERTRQSEVTLLSQLFTADTSEAACAFAVARLASERVGGTL